jgi:poly-gamma-glutamate synthesis protein (capsule biosynthesis protein)
MVNILIGADICPIEGNLPFFTAGDARSLFHDLLPEFESADLVIANLECPLIERPSPIEKTGPVFGAPGDCINGIKAGGVDVLCLANNHIMDHGAAGLQSTLDVCARAGVSTVGAGLNLQEARRILVKQVGKLRIGIMAVAEHEFSIAAHGHPGASPLDVMEFVRAMKRERATLDYLIVLLHGSAEFHVPTPRIQETCRFMIELGANAVIVQHPHCLGGWEEYLGGHIVYGQGALVMDEAKYRDLKSFHEGFLVRLLVADDATSQMEILPFIQSDPVPGARKMPEQAGQAFRQKLEEQSRLLKNAGFVEAQWRTYVDRQRHGYLSVVLGHNRILKKLNSTGLLTRFLYGRRRLLGMRNCIVCETHHEALQTILTERRE